jgi:hypothetical protein
VLRHVIAVRREWCRQQMLALRRDPDLTLVEFLMGVPSAGETMEYIDMYLKEDVKQKAARDAFANEFLKCACFARSPACLPPVIWTLIGTVPAPHCIMVSSGLPQHDTP